MLEKLWNDYLSDECAAMETEEERALAKRALELHARITTLFGDEQRAVAEEYTDALCEINAVFAKKAFLKGCEFAVSFLLEAGREQV